MRISIDESAGMLVALQLRVAVVLLIWCVVRRLTHTSSARLQSCLDRLLGAILCLYVVEEVAATGPPLERRVQLRLQVERSRRGSPRSFSLVTASAVLLMVAAHGVAWRPATAEDDAARAAGFELESLVWRPEGLIDLAGSARGAHFWDSTTVAFSPDGRLIATGSGNTTGVLHLWDAPTLRGLALVDRLPGGVESVSFSLDGKYLAAAINNSVVRYDEDRSAEIRIWELSANGLGKEHRLTGFKTSFAALDISRRHVMAAANRRGRVHIFDLSGEHPLERPSLTAQSVWSLAFSPDGRRLAAGGSKRTFVWDMSGPQPQRLGDLDGAALSLAFSGDSKLLATGSFASDPMIQLWSLSGDEATLAAEAALDTKRGIRGVEFVGDTLIGCLGRPEKAMVWSTADGGLRRLDNPPIGDCWAAAWNKKTNHVAVVGEGRLEVWDFNTSPPARTAASQSAIDAPRFRNAAFLENDNLLAGLVSDRPAVYDRRRRELVFQTPHVAETPLSLVASSS
ncbi:MAG: hypothetical protein QF805_26860, partial [Pirellulaceae bacterium]|nr:hypothetical protein [Pirellulaceae bacterium]